MISKGVDGKYNVSKSDKYKNCIDTEGYVGVYPLSHFAGMSFKVLLQDMPYTMQGGGHNLLNCTYSSGRHASLKNYNYGVDYPYNENNILALFVECFKNGWELLEEGGIMMVKCMDTLGTPFSHVFAFLAIDSGMFSFVSKYTLVQTIVRKEGIVLDHSSTSMMLVFRKRQGSAPSSPFRSAFHILSDSQKDYQSDALKANAKFKKAMDTVATLVGYISLTCEDYEDFKDKIQDIFGIKCKGKDFDDKLTYINMKEEKNFHRLQTNYEKEKDYKLNGSARALETVKKRPVPTASVQPTLAHFRIAKKVAP